MILWRVILSFVRDPCQAASKQPGAVLHKVVKGSTGDSNIQDDTEQHNSMDDHEVPMLPFSAQFRPFLKKRENKYLQRADKICTKK